MELHKSIFRLITAHNEVGARLCFYTCLWFCSQGGRGGIPACIAGGIPACLAAGLGGGGGIGIPACLAGFQAHTQGRSWGVWPVGGGGGGGSPGPHPGGSPGPHLDGSQVQGVSRPTPGGVSQHAPRQTPPMATAAGGRHPTGMHSCSYF